MCVCVHVCVRCLSHGIGVGVGALIKVCQVDRSLRVTILIVIIKGPLRHGQENPSIIDEAAKIFGSQAVVINIEAKSLNGSWNCYSDCGRIPSNRNVLPWLKEVEERGAGEVIIQSVDTDGRQRGFDRDLISASVSQANIPVIAASGAGTLEDIVDIRLQQKNYTRNIKSFY